MKSSFVYLDHAATTPTDPAVFEEMIPYFGAHFGNASSTHVGGREAVAAVDRAREQVAKALGAEIGSIYFTSCGTESDNWAIQGVADAFPEKRHIISTAVEHPAVLQALQRLRSRGYDITYLPVDPEGRIDPADAISAMREDTLLVSVMLANNEVGTVQPVKEIVESARARGILSHTDAVQAVGSIPVNVKDLGVDMLSLSAHKFYGPKGVGALYIKKGVKIKGLLLGGEQERGLRGGTYNTPGIVGLGAAITLATESLAEHSRKVNGIRDFFLQEVEHRISFVKRNGGGLSLPGIANLLFYGVKNSDLLAALDREGIAASAGSACSSGSVEPSHVLAAMGLSLEEIRSSVRFSFGKENTKEDALRTVDVLVRLISRLREDSDLFLKLSQTHSDI